MGKYLVVEIRGIGDLDILRCPNVLVFIPMEEMKTKFDQ